MRKLSAALVVFLRSTDGVLEVFLAHPGGPFWMGRDLGAWTFPKGEIEPGEDPLAAARREFYEEVGQPAPDGIPTPLGSLRQASGKVITAFAIETTTRLSFVASNDFEIEWPRHSGNLQYFPEVDAGAWFTVDSARDKLATGQQEFLDRLIEVQLVS